MATVYERKHSPFQFVMIAVCVFLCIITLFPILNIVALSFSDGDSIQRGEVGLVPKGFNLSAYEMVFKDHSMIRAFWFSLALMIAKTALSMTFTVLAAYPLSKRRLPGRNGIMLVILITMYFSAGTIPDYLMYKSLGILNTVWVLLLPGLISSFNLIVLRTFFASIDDNLYDAAYIDGCSETRALLQIALPLAKAALLTIAMFYAVDRWNSVTDIILYVQKPEYYTLQFKLKLMLDLINLPYEEGGDMMVVPENFKSACVVFTMVPMLVIYPFVQKYFREGVMIGSVKG